MAVHWGNDKIGLGKDVYHITGVILPHKRVAATGRIHFLADQYQTLFSYLETKGVCFHSTAPSRTSPIQS
ncbi:hypothetical protein ACE1TI_00825 [Alteribacillus sp. JSM 102045]|uniref:hypothetical protein n=1 Tax=Alteribacillus sp. JSM 102045 TaxID=1562101 RepID=UPI0035C0824D